MIEETEYFTIFFEESNYRFIQSGKGFVTLILTGIVDGPAVEHIPSSIAGGVIRNPFLISKAHHLDSKLPLFQAIRKLFQSGKFP